MTTPPKTAWDQGVPLSETLEMYSSEELWREFEPFHEKFSSVIPADFPREPFKKESQPALTVSPAEEASKYARASRKAQSRNYRPLSEMANFWA